MRAPLSWLRDYVDLPPDEDARAVAARLVRAGLEVEKVETPGHDVSGPVVVGRVLDFTEETHSNGRTIRWCQVRVGDDDVRGIVCGARNFSVGDDVVVALPGSVLAGGFEISARKTYGHVSDGMICSARELGLGDDHTGILVLPTPVDAPLGSDALPLLGVRDAVFDISVTPDRGYCLSMRGIAREAATAYGLPLRDPADVPVPDLPAGYSVILDDPLGCDRFVARTVTGIDPSATSPLWMRRRLGLAGMRPISLVVDVTNYVMLETGQPIHAYDRTQLSGPLRARRAASGETLQTLDGVTRALDSDDLLIADDSGPLGLAGIMGGGSTEISPLTTEIVVEAAHFDAITIARSSRRHRLSTEASRRFERGVDPALPERATQRVAELLGELAGASVEVAATIVGVVPLAPQIRMAASYPGDVAGRDIDPERVVEHLIAVGCGVDVADVLVVTPPSWRPDLLDPADLVEEVLRLEGYDSIPSTLPVAPVGRGYTREQRLRRVVGRALAGAGFAETPSHPFVGRAAWDALGIDASDARRHTVHVVNPMSDEEPELRTTLLPGVLRTLQRNVSRGFPDLALFEAGVVFLPREGQSPAAPRVTVDRRPDPEQLAALDAALPDQPWHVAVALCGAWQQPGWWGPARAVSWADAVEAVRTIGRSVGVALQIRADDLAPWHPGRCAAILLPGSDRVIGHAGELHPRVIAALGLPARTCAAEVDLSAILVAAAAEDVDGAPLVSPYPLAKEDVALVVDATTPAAEVEAALRDGAGELLESLRLFDVYAGAQVPPGHRSLAYALRFRAPDRTLTLDEVSAARDEAVAEAGRRTGAVLRSA
ncbi:MAG TPA: phenylalanine--tRNA ligase subunit beta [Actinomycetes bacterium]|nr:phenylalanine--tRNA ligase subunit beta [Actinomycetes bacterium]